MSEQYTPNPYQQTIRELRQKLDNNIRLRDTLEHGSSSREVLQTQIDTDTQQLVRLQRRAKVAHAQAELQNRRNDVIGGALLFFGFGAGVTRFAWGTEWVLVGVLLLLLGLTGVIATATDS